MQIEVDKEERSISVVEAIPIRDREFEPFAFRINSETLPELVEPYQPRKRGAGRPAKGPFDPARDIPEDVTARRWMPFLRRAASAATANTKNG